MGRADKVCWSGDGCSDLPWVPCQPGQRPPECVEVINSTAPGKINQPKPFSGQNEKCRQSPKPLSPTIPSFSVVTFLLMCVKTNSQQTGTIDRKLEMSVAAGTRVSSVPFPDVA